MAYANNTKVSTEQSEVQIKALLRKHGAHTIMIGDNPEMVAIQFSMKNRQIRFVIPIPSIDDDDIKFTNSGRIRTKIDRVRYRDQVMRQKYRLLFLVIKAKLESVEGNVVSFEDEFLAQTVMADGKTVGELIQPQIENMYENGNMPPLLGQM